MKYFAPILIALFILLAVLGGLRMISAWSDAHQAAWTVEANGKAILNLQDEQNRVRNAAERRAWFTEFYRILFTGLAVIAAVGAIVYYWKVVDERQESKARMVDGSYALQTFRNAQGQQWTVDPNKATFGVFGFKSSSGELITDANMIGPDHQLTYAMGIQRTRTAQAQPISEIRNSAQAKYASGYYDRHDKYLPGAELDFPELLEPSLLESSSYQPLSLVDAFAQSTADRWLLGNGVQGPCSFSVRDVVHTGLIGATKTGKTSSTALLMALNARKQGMQVIALDGAGGVDWNPYRHVFEVHESDYTTIGDQINELVRIHELRMKALKVAGVSNLDELDYQLPSLFVVMEEHGRTMQAFQAASKKQYTLTESALSNLMRVSRQNRHLLFID